MAADGETTNSVDSVVGWRVFARPLVILLLFLLLFLAARIALYGLYLDRIGDFTGSELLRIGVRGELYDISAILSFIGLPLLLMVLPFPWARSRLCQGVLGWFCYFVFVLLALLLMADLVYFGYGNGHIGQEITILEEDFDQTLELATGRYLWWLIGYLAGCVAVFVLFRRVLRRDAPRVSSPFARWAPAALILGVAFVGIRGGVSGERLVPAHAGEGVPSGGKHLALNAPFNALHYVLKFGVPSVDFHPWEEAVADVEALLVAPDEVRPDPAYPLYRQRPARPGARPNVILVMLEGWSAASMDSYRAGEPSRGLTPRFDGLCDRGLLFTRFFATGRRTRNGFSGALAAMPSLPDLPYVGKGLEEVPLSWIGRLAAEEGYDTWFLSGSKRSSQRQDHIAREAGFAHMVGMEDLQLSEGGRGRKKALDGDLWRGVSARIAKAREPYFLYVHTASTHAPYVYPASGWNRFGDGTEQHEYWNCLSYADHAFGEFLLTAEKLGLLENTILVVTSDHTQRHVTSTLGPAALFHVPCLVVAPGLAPGRDDRIGSQTDLMPTVADLAGWSAPHSAFGRSLFDDAGPNRGAVCSDSEEVLRVEAGGWVRHNLRQRIDAGTFQDGGDLSAIEHRLLSFVQVATRLWLKRRIHPGAR